MENKYKTLSEFKKEYEKEYHILRHRKLLGKLCEDMGWDIPKSNKCYGYWTKERCLEEALKYNTRSEWRKNHRNSYQAACSAKFLIDCCSHMIRRWKPAGYWTKERCMKEAKKYSKKIEWQKGSSTSYLASVKNGWFKECIIHMIQSRKPAGYWTKEKCLEEAKKYEYKTDWWKYSNGSYNSAKNNGWLEECVVHMKIKKINGK